MGKEEQTQILTTINQNIIIEVEKKEEKLEPLQHIIDDVFTKYEYSTKPHLKRDENYILSYKFSDISRTNWLSTRSYLCRFLEKELPLFLKENLKNRSIPFSKYVNKIRSGEYIPEKYYSSEETNFIYLRVNNISSNELNLEEPVFLQDNVGSQYKNIALNQNDLVLTRSGTVGKCVIFQPDPQEDKLFIPSHHLAVIHFAKTEGAVFLKYYLQSSFGSDFLWAFSTGKSQKEITNWSIRKLPIPAIDDRTIDKIVFEIQQREEQSMRYKEEIKKLRAQIDDLLYRSLRQY